VWLFPQPLVSSTVNTLTSLFCFYSTIFKLCNKSSYACILRILDSDICRERKVNISRVNAVFIPDENKQNYLALHRHKCKSISHINISNSL